MTRRAITTRTVVVLAIGSGCGADDGPPRTQAASVQTPPAQPASAPSATARKQRRGRQQLLTLPKAGRLFAQCDDADRFDFEYEAASGQSERVVITVGGRRVAARTVHPGQSVRFSAPVIRGGAGDGQVDAVAPIALTSTLRRKPYTMQAKATLRLADAFDGSGECVAVAARVRIDTDFNTP